MDKAIAEFGRRLARLIKERDLSQAELARRVGVAQPSAWKWFNGTMPHLRTVKAIAAVLEVDAEWLVTGKGDERSAPALTMQFERARLAEIAERIGRAAGELKECADALRDEISPPKLNRLKKEAERQPRGAKRRG